jgi:hypothetical protein
MKRESGASPIEFALGTMLILFPAAMLALAFGPWMEHRLFVRTAAGEAARVLVLDVSPEPELTALDMVARLAVNLGIDPSKVRVGFCGGAPRSLSGSPSGRCSPLGRGGLAEVTVEVDVPPIVTPLAEVGGWPVAATHVEAVDLYRSRP